MVRVPHETLSSSGCKVVRVSMLLYFIRTVSLYFVSICSIHFDVVCSTYALSAHQSGISRS